jgi:hypothetical protein
MPRLSWSITSSILRIATNSCSLAPTLSDASACDATAQVQQNAPLRRHKFYNYLNTMPAACARVARPIRPSMHIR